MPEYGKERYNRVRRFEMQKEATLTSKGQITIPHEIRQLLGVKTGDKLVFENDGTRTHVRPVRKTSPFAKFRGIGNSKVRGRKRIVQAVRQLRGQ